jgi:hypothetical protein
MARVTPAAARSTRADGNLVDRDEREQRTLSWRMPTSSWRTSRTRLSARRSRMALPDRHRGAPAPAASASARANQGAVYVFALAAGGKARSGQASRS